MWTFLANTGDIWDHIERLGGWAVVAWIVVWGVQRMNRRDDQLTEILDQHKTALSLNSAAISEVRRAVDGAIALEQEERRIHDVLDRKLDMIWDAVGGKESK